MSKNKEKSNNIVDTRLFVIPNDQGKRLIPKEGQPKRYIRPEGEMVPATTYYLTAIKREDLLVGKKGGN